jgi:hypothetical protein
MLLGAVERQLGIASAACPNADLFSGLVRGFPPVGP